MTNEVKIELTGLTDRIREAVVACEVPDSTVIAHEIRASLEPDEVEEALRRGLRLLVERETRYQRAEVMRQAREQAGLSYAERREQESQEAAEQLAEITESHQQRVAERFFAVWKETPTGRKFLGECTVEDLRYSAERHRDRSDQALHGAACDDSLADALASSGAGTVRELGYEAAAKAMSDVAA